MAITNKENIFYKCGSEICKACTNTSTAKFQYSFSKAPRFPGDKIRTKEEIQEQREKERQRREEEAQMIKEGKYVKHDYYSLPSTLNKRYCNFGFGNKTDFTAGKKYDKTKGKNEEGEEKKELTDEQKQQLKLKRLTEFAEYEYEKKYYHGPKYSFPRYGKEKFKRKKRKEDEDKEKEQQEQKGQTKKEDEGDELVKIPGPGSYNLRKQFGYDAPKYSFPGIPDQKLIDTKKEVQKRREEYEEKNKKKVEIKDVKDPNEVVPHVTIQIRKTGKYAPSQIPNISAPKIEKPDKYKIEQQLKLEKIRKEKGEEPEQEEEKPKFEKVQPPDDKADRKLIKNYYHSLMGTNFPSKYRSNEGASFASKYKVIDSRDNYPGPGSYPIPSEFGVYVSKTPEENVYPVPKQEVERAPWRHGMKVIKPKEDGDIGGDGGDGGDGGYGGNDENIGESSADNQENQEENKNEEETKQPGEGDNNKNEDENKEEEKKEEEKQKEEDKKSELEMLYDILMYKENN